jgi:hypothetical protein
LRAISHLPTFGGKLSTFGCVDHPSLPVGPLSLHGRHPHVCWKIDIPARFSCL